MLVPVLIGLMIAVVVGVTTIPVMMSSLSSDNITDAAGKATGASALIDILPFIFVAIVLLGAVAFIGRGVGKGGYEKPIHYEGETESTEEDLYKPKRRGSFRSFLIGVGNIVTWPLTRGGKIK